MKYILLPLREKYGLPVAFEYDRGTGVVTVKQEVAPVAPAPEEPVEDGIRG